MRNRDLAIIITITMCIAVLPLSGWCASGSPQASPGAASSSYPMNVTDNFGRVSTIPQLPQRIVSLSPANTEILFDLGLGDKIVGGTEYDDYPPAAENITHVGGFSTVDDEMVVNVSPDVIFAEDTISMDAVNKLQSMGFTVILLDNSNMTMIENNIKLIGEVTGTESNATALVNDINARMSNISDKTASVNASQRPSVLLLAGYVSGGDIYVYGSGTYGADLITLAGGTNAAANITSYGVMSPEAIIAADPDYIIDPVGNSMGDLTSFNSLKNGSVTWMQDMTAYKEGHIIMVDGNVMERPGPRLPDAALEIAQAIHPELFQAAPTATAATPTPTPTPGFETVFALAGLLGVAYVIARKEH